MLPAAFVLTCCTLTSNRFGNPDGRQTGRCGTEAEGWLSGHLVASQKLGSLLSCNLEKKTKLTSLFHNKIKEIMTDCENTVLFFKLLICLLTASQRRAYEGPFLRGSG